MPPPDGTIPPLDFGPLLQSLKQPAQGEAPQALDFGPLIKSVQEDPTGAAAQMGWEPERQEPTGAWSRIGEAAKQGYFSADTIFNEPTRNWMEQHGLGRDTILDFGQRLLNAGITGGTQAAYEAAKALGLPETLSRDIAANVENLGMSGASHGPVEAGRTALEMQREGREARAALAGAAEGRPQPQAGAELQAEAGLTPGPAAPSPTPVLDQMAEEARQRQAAPPPPAATLPEPTPPAGMRSVHDDQGRWIGYERTEPEAAPPETADNLRKPPETPAEPVSRETQPAAEAELPLAEPTAPEAPKGETAYERVPREPKRLIQRLREPTVVFPGTLQEDTIPGGLIDSDGDISKIIGGPKGRPTLINGKGWTLDDAALRMHAEGYFPEVGPGERPTIDDLKDAIRDDHMGIPRYSIRDQEAVEAFNRAMEHNAEIDRLSSQTGIDPKGMSRQAFYDAVQQHLTAEEVAREAAETDRRGTEKAAEVERVAKEELPGARSPKDLYEQSQARTLEDLEREYQQESAASEAGQRLGAIAEAGRERSAEIAGEGTQGPVGTRAEPTGRGEAGAAQDLLGRPIAEPRERAQAAPTIRNDERQIGLPGTEPSAVQAQAARDAGRGTLQADVTQRPADEGLFAPDISGQGQLPTEPPPAPRRIRTVDQIMRDDGVGAKKAAKTQEEEILAAAREIPPEQGGATLYSFPGMLADPEMWRKAFGPLGPPLRSLRNLLTERAQLFGHWMYPMRSGGITEQAYATRFANILRGIQFRYTSIDKELAANFTPQERSKMGAALDAQSVFEQQVRQLPEAEQAAARDAFEKGQTGLAGLTDKQRKPMEALNVLANDVWERMRQRGMVSPEAKPLPYYMPRQILMWSEENGFSRPGPGGGGGGGNKGIEPIGTNLTTAGPMHREYLTPEETQAAARASLGRGATLLQDIRMLPSRLAYAERAIAGTDLINGIEQMGKDAGVNTVIRGDIPGLLRRADYFTISDHPSFTKWTGNGWQRINVLESYRGPLNAVLSKPSGALYRGAMTLKSGVMQTIMWSPFQHLNVEIGRAFPMMRTEIVSVFKDGHRVRQDLNYMDQATADGIAPLGHTFGWRTDPVSIAEQTLDPTRNSFIRAVTEMRDQATAWMSPGWRHVIEQPHQALLWDRVFDLQMGIYDHLRTKFTNDGFPDRVAGIMAAHLANRYAGALPPEHLARAANMASNLLLFSRSFTLGNLGVIKDMFNGAPGHLRALIEHEAGPEMAQQAQQALRNKARAAFTLDIGLQYIGTALAQSAWRVGQIAAATYGVAGLANALSNGVQQVGADWKNKAGLAMANVMATGNPLAAFGVLPQHWNEPGKQDRVYLGTGPQGRGEYARLTFGKLGEEFVGWFSRPGDLLLAKLSPMVSGIAEEIFGHDTLGRPLIKPNPTTIGDYISNAGDIVKHIATRLGPTATLQGIGELFGNATGTHKETTQEMLVSAAKVLGPATGLFSLSQGYPGGPAAGELHAQQQRMQYEQQKAMPAIRDLIRQGKAGSARQEMTKLGLPPKEQSFFIRQTEKPGRITPRQVHKFERGASPETIQRFQLERGSP